MKKFIFLLVSVLLVFASMNVFAEGDALTAVFDPEARAVKISGTVSSEGGALATVAIVKHGGGNAFSKENVPDIFYMYTLDDEGGIDVTVPFSEKLLSGRYDIFVNGVFGEKQMYVIYRNENDSATLSLVDAINEAESSAEITAIVNEGSNAEILGIDRESDDAKKYLPDFCDESYEIRESLGGGKFTAKSFYDSYAAFVACEYIAEGKIDEAMLSYAYVFGTTYEAYSAIDSDIKKELTELLESSELAIAGLTGTYSELCLLAEIRAAESWSEMKDIIMANENFIGLDTSDYDDIKSTQQYKVFTSMYSDRDSFKTTEGVAEAFKKASDDVLDDTKSTGGKGGSGGGGSSSKNTLPTIAVDINPDNIIPDTSADTSEIEFVDLDGHFSEEYVHTLAGKGVINGYADGVFAPDKQVTRAEFSKMIVLLFEINTEASESFEDVQPSDWFSPYVGKLSAAGVVTGYNGRFNPNDFITRQDAALICYRVLNYLGITASGESTFADHASISDYAVGAVEALSANGVILGSNNNFYPADDITRGESAAMLCRLNDKFAVDAD